MERLGASSLLPLAIRARLSTDDSASDASSSSFGDSDGNSGVEVAEEEESYETAEDDAASPRRPSMPRAQITGDDEDDDVLGEAVFEDYDDDEEENLKLAVEDAEAVSSTGGDYEYFGDGFVAGEVEGGFSNAGDEDDHNMGDGGFVIASLEDLHLRVNEKGYFENVQTMASLDDDLANDSGLELKEVKSETDGSDAKVEAEKDLDSITSVHDKIEAISSGAVEQTSDSSSELKDLLVVFRKMDIENNNIVGDIEEFDGGFVSGREESGLTIGSYENDGNLVAEGPAIASLKELQIQVKEKGFFEKAETMHSFEDALENDGSLEFNEVKMEMEGSDVIEVDVEEDLDSIAEVYDKIGAVNSGDVEQSNDFAAELKDLVVESCNTDTEEKNLAAVIQRTWKSVMEVELSALAYEAQAGNLGIPEAEDNQEEMVKIGAVGTISPSQNWNEEMQPKAEEAEFSVWEVMQEQASQVEADSTEFKGFEATNAVDFIHRKIVEIVTLPDSKTFESKSAETDNMGTKKGSLYVNTCSVDSQKANDSACKLQSLIPYENAHESCYPIKEICIENTVAYHAEFLDDVKEKHGSRAIVTQISTTENCNACEYSSDEFSSYYAPGKEMESMFDSFHVSHDERSGEEDEHVISEWAARDATLENSEIVKHILEEMEESSSSSHSGFNCSQNHSHILDSQIISDSYEEVKTEGGGSAEELFDTSALAALLRASSGSSGKVSDLISEDSSSIFSVKHQAGFRSTNSFWGHPHTPFVSACTTASSDWKFAGEYGNSLNDEEKMLHLRADQMRLKYLHLVQSLGHFADDALPNHVLSRLGLAGGVTEGRKISEERCIEEKCNDDFAFSCNILVLGKTGVGKSAAINSIFGEERAPVDAFQPATTSVREISGMVDGFYVSVIDTPGLLTSLNDQGANRKILTSVKKYIRRTPDVFLYVDRLDTHTGDLDDLLILRMITRILGSSIWHNAIIVLTHAASGYSDGPDGSLLSYEVIVARRSYAVQQAIRQAAGDVGLVNPVALVENHHSCSKNMDGESLLPNGLRWKAWLLLLCYSTKILSEVNSILKPSRNQGTDNYVFDTVSDNTTNEVPGDDEYDHLPSLNSFRRFQAQKLISEQKNAYFDKCTYQHELLQKKQLKDEQGFTPKDNSSAVPIPLPDMESPPSFYSENTKHCYQCLEPKSQLLTRPVMFTHYWDHDSGYDGAIIEENIDISCLFPIPLSVQITMDKKEFSLYLGSSISSKRGKNGSTLANIRPVGNQLVQGAKFSNLKRKNKTAVGILFTFSEDTVMDGFKLDDLVFQGKKLPLVTSNGGVVRAESVDAYEADLKLHLNKSFSCRKRISISDLSVIKWRDLFLGANLQFELHTRQNSAISVRVGINNPNSGQISIRTSTTNQVHVALLGIFTIVLSICRSMTKGTN